MKIGVYAYHHETQVGFDALQKGAGRLGHTIIRRNPSPFTPDQVEDFDIVSTWGSSRAKLQSIVDSYAAVNIPTLVLEMSYFLRQEYISIGLNKQYWMPDTLKPSTRWEKLGIEIKPYRMIDDGYILVCSQDMDSQWEDETVRKLKLITNRKIIVRKHPTWVAKADRIPLEEQLKGAYCMVVDTSNVANEALVEGIPVVCSKHAMFAEISTTDLNDIDNIDISKLPEREQYFYRLAYGQWTAHEIENSDVLTWYIDQLLDTKRDDINPEDPQPSIAAITCTGDRPEAMKFCIEYMTRQTIKPDEWIIVDDGVDFNVSIDMFINCGVNDIKIIHREREEKDHPHTMPINLYKALEVVKARKIIIFEDDDWYSSKHIAQTSGRLDYDDLVGIQGIYYWNIARRSFQPTGQNKPHSSFCQTAFTDKVINMLKYICIHGDPHDSRTHQLGLIDLAIWKQWAGSSRLYDLTMDVIGIKGLPGRPGLTTGHKRINRYKHDRNLEELKYFIKGDVNNYLPHKHKDAEI